MKKIDINKTIFTLILFFPISTILQGIKIFDPINKILIGGLIVLFLIKNVKTEMKRENIIVLFFTFIVYFFSILFTESRIENFNDIFYFAIWILFFIWIKDNYEKFKVYIKEKKELIYEIVILWNVIVFVSLFFSTSYNLHWGNEFYFKSFSNGEHRFAAACVFIFALSCVIVKEKESVKYFVFSILPLLSIFLSGTRVYLGVIFIFCGCIYYVLCNKKYVFYLSCIPIAIMGSFFVMLTPMGEKIISTFNNPDYNFIDAFTNGRTLIWNADIKAFFNLDLLRQIVGNGYNFIYDVNESVFARIWAHNDIINILLTYGYIGVILYFYVLFSVSQKILKSMNVSKVIVIGYYFIWLFNAMFNMVYTYTNATFALPFMLYFFSEFEKKYNKNV